MEETAGTTPSGDSAAVVDTATTETTVGDTTDVSQVEDDGLLEQEPIEDDVEEEVDGVKLKGKKDALEKWKSERLMQADYTRKTQDVAELRKTAETERAQYQQAAQLQQHFAQDLGELRVIDRELAKFQQVNWENLTNTDPVQALKLHTTFTQLQAQRGQLASGLAQKDQQLRAFNESEDSKRANAAEAVVMREIKDWGPEKYRQLQEFAKTDGVDAESLRRMLINVPNSAKILMKAMKWTQLEQARAKKPPAEPAAPVTRVTGAKAAVTKDLSNPNISDAEYAAIRKRQIAQRSSNVARR